MIFTVVRPPGLNLSRLKWKVDSPEKAVRAAIVQDYKNKQ